MPKVQLEFRPAPGINVERDFIDLYGGSKKNWDWLLEQIREADPVKLKALCQPLVVCDRVKLPPVWVFGRLDIKDETAWLDGLHKGTFWMEAVVHDSYATKYYEARLAAVPEDTQDL